MLRLGQESLVFGLSGIISKFISFFLLPFFARKLSLEEYGEIALLNSIFFFLSTISTLGLDSAAFRWYFDEQEEGKRVRIFNTWFVTQLFFTIIIICILFIINPFINQRFFSSSLRIYFFPLLAVNLFLNIIPQVASAWYRVKQKPWHAISFSLIAITISSFLSILFVIVFELGTLGFFGAQACGFLIATLLGIISTTKLLKFRKPDFSLLKRKLRYGLSILPATLAAATLIMITNFIIQSNISQAELGIYQMGNNFAMLILLFTSAFAQAWPPFSFSQIGNPQAHKTFSRSLNVYVYLLSFIAFILSAFLPEILLIVTTEKFSDSAMVGGILAYMYFINSLSVIAITGLSIIKKVQPYSLVIIFSAIVTIVLELILVNKGKEAVSIAILIGQILPPVILFYLSQKKYFIPFQFGKVVIVILASFLLFLFSQSYFSMNVWTSVMARLGLALMLLLLIGALERNHFGSLKPLFIQMKSRLLK